MRILEALEEHDKKLDRIIDLIGTPGPRRASMELSALVRRTERQSVKLQRVAEALKTTVQD